MRVKRQTRERARLMEYRVLQPGEIDHEVDHGQLVTPHVPAWDAPTLAVCARLYDRCVRSTIDGPIPDSAFCDLPRWVFLEYLVQFCDVLLFGSNHPYLTRLAPV